MNPRLALLLSTALLLPAMVGADERVSEASDRTGLSLTLYNEDLALVRERREVELPAGVVDLALRGVSGRMQAETALLQDGDGKGDLEVLEQNFNYDLLTPAKLLEKYLGREIRIRRTNPANGEEQTVRAKVLSTQGGLVVRIGDRIETNPGGRFLFDDIPADLRDQPTLVTRLKTEGGGRRTLELSYLSGGLSWRADYVARLDRDGRRLDLAGWVTLDNRSGTAYRNARLQLVAGDLNRVATTPPRQRFKQALAMAEADTAIREEGLFEYHLYSLPRTTDLLDRQTKQVALLEARNLGVEKEYLLQGHAYYYRQQGGEPGRRLPVQVWLNFRNDRDNHLGMPLPGGIVRVYQADRSGSLQFVGEDRIGHTPEGERVRLRLGNAFDVTATRLQTSWARRDHGHPYRGAAESGYRIELRNAGGKPVTVTVQEPIPGDWRITRESLPHAKADAHTAQWRVEVPARGRAVLEYGVLVRW